MTKETMKLRGNLPHGDVVSSSGTTDWESWLRLQFQLQALLSDISCTEGNLRLQNHGQSPSQSLCRRKPPQDKNLLSTTCR